jgi:hypothetical protein
MVPSHEYGNIGNDTAKWDDGWFSDTIHARKFEGDLLDVTAYTADTITVNTINAVDVYISGLLDVTGETTSRDDWHLLSDSAKLYLGAFDDAGIYYDDTDLIIDPKIVGSGKVSVPGSIFVTDYFGIGNEPGNANQRMNCVFATEETSAPQYGYRMLGLYGSPGSGNMSLEAYGMFGDFGTAATYDGDYLHNINGVWASVSHRGSGLLAGAYGGRFSVAVHGSGNITNARAGSFSIGDAGAGSIINAYGMWVSNITVGTTLNYAVYTNAGMVHFGDDVEILGDLTFSGAGSGLPYAEIYVYDAGATITIGGTGIGNKVQIDTFDADGVSNLATPDHTNDHITITKAGDYRVAVSLTAESTGAAAYNFGFAVYKNDGATLFQNLHAHREFSGAGGDTGSVSISGIATFAVADTIEVWCWNETNTNNIVIDDINLSISMVGGA